MKYILKRNEPQSFTDLKLRANVGWEPAYNTLSGDVKKAVKDSLIAEQGHICCYCECRITSINSHIEHFCPQSEQKVDPLDYSNLACSCLMWTPFLRQWLKIDSLTENGVCDEAKTVHEGTQGKDCP